MGYYFLPSEAFLWNANNLKRQNSDGLSYSHWEYLSVENCNLRQYRHSDRNASTWFWIWCVFCFRCPALSGIFSEVYLARRRPPAVMEIYPFQGIYLKFYPDFLFPPKFVGVSQKKFLAALRILKKALHLRHITLK